MNSRDLFDVIGQIDEAFVNLPIETVRLSQRVRCARRRIAAAVCTVAAVTAVWLTLPVSSDPVPIRFPDPISSNSLVSGSSSWEETQYYSYKELADMADYVVCARVKETFWEQGKWHYYPYVEIIVTEVIKGDGVRVGESRLVRDNGIGYFTTPEGGGVSYESTACGGPLMERGNKVILFLQRDATWVRSSDDQIRIMDKIVPWDSGKFYWDSDGKYHPSATYHCWFPERYMTPEMLQDYTPKTLDEIKEQIQSS